MPFVTFEGIDGVGKTSVINGLKPLLEEYDPVYTREPYTDSMVGGCLKSALTLILSGHDRVDDRTQVLLYQTMRSDHLTRVIEPALRDDRLVISDRYIDSTYAYQTCVKLEYNCVYSYWVKIPDITFLFYSDDLQSIIDRLSTRDGREYVEISLYLDAVQTCYFNMAKEDGCSWAYDVNDKWDWKNRWICINVDRPLADVVSLCHENIRKMLRIKYDR